MNSLDADPLAFAVNSDRDCFGNIIGLQDHCRIHWNQKGQNPVVEILEVDSKSDLDHWSISGIWCCGMKSHWNLKYSHSVP